MGPSRAYGGPRAIRAIFLAAILILGAWVAREAPAQSLPEGYSLDASGVDRGLPQPWEASTGDFIASVRRDAPDSASARLLAIAESTYPPRGVLLAIAFGKGYELGSDTAAAPLWWCRGIGASRIPYAVTARAVEHYARLTELYRDRDFRSAGTRPLFESELLYRGAIGHRDRFTLGRTAYEDVYVAHLKLHWRWDDGTFEALTEAERVVVLNAAGDVLAVQGDGQAEERVAISGTRQPGRFVELPR